MQPRHLPVLDGLRAVAVLLVLWCHVPLTTPGYPDWLKTTYALVGPGGLGVEIFFVLSGFLITRILIDERDREVPVRWFLLRRVLRIFPIYYLLLLVMLVLQPSTEIAWCAVYLSNLHSILEPTHVSPLGHTWSLCIEEHFYLLWPLVVAFAPRRLPGYLLGCVVMPGALLGAYWIDLHYAAGNADPNHTMMAVQHASPIRFLSLGAGSLLAYREARIVAAPGRYAALAAVLLVPAFLLSPVVACVLMPSWFSVAPLIPLQHVPLAWLVHSCCLSTSIVLLCLTLPDARWSPLRVLRTRLLRGIGRISYGLYLYHLPIYFWLLIGQPTAGNVALALSVSFAAATISYLAIERPILRAGARFR